MTDEFINWKNGSFIKNEFGFPLMLELLGDVKGKTNLDVGCGHGWLQDDLVKRGATRAVGTDFSQKLIDYAKKTYTDSKCRFDYGDVLDSEWTNDMLKLNDGEKYDGSVSMSVIVHMETTEHIRKYFKSVFDTLKEGGSVFVTQVPDNKSFNILGGKYGINTIYVDENDQETKDFVLKDGLRGYNIVNIEGQITKMGTFY
jgi:cyclopropane fatty-acyl-phospholipid synthase-like methyltransferase